MVRSRHIQDKIVTDPADDKVTSLDWGDRAANRNRVQRFVKNRLLPEWSRIRHTRIVREPWDVYWGTDTTVISYGLYAWLFMVSSKECSGHTSTSSRHSQLVSISSLFIDLWNSYVKAPVAAHVPWTVVSGYLYPQVTFTTRRSSQMGVDIAQKRWYSDMQDYLLHETDSFQRVSLKRSWTKVFSNQFPTTTSTLHSPSYPLFCLDVGRYMVHKALSAILNSDLISKSKRRMIWYKHFLNSAE